MEVIFPSFFNIRTAIAADSRSKFIGCIGEINYRILELILLSSVVQDAKLRWVWE